MRVCLDFSMENAAFHDDPGGELQRLLTTARYGILGAFQQLRDEEATLEALQKDSIAMSDVNGNVVGYLTFPLAEKP